MVDGGTARERRESPTRGGDSRDAEGTRSGAGEPPQREKPRKLLGQWVMPRLKEYPFKTQIWDEKGAVFDIVRLLQFVLEE
jgi:hypothetical protein